nr:hypothetical protein [Tanacetum cinerariifolium]
MALGEKDQDQDANEATSNRIRAPKNLEDRSLLNNIVYENVLEMTEKITYLQSRYVDNVVKKMNGEDVEGQMDPIDKQIFDISHDIWGLKDDGHGVVNNNNVDENLGFMT